MPTIPLDLFRSSGDLQPSGRRRASITRVAENQPSDAFAQTGNEIAEGTERAASSIGRSLTQLEYQVNEIRQKSKEADEVVSASKAFTAGAEEYDNAKREIEQQAPTDVDTAAGLYQAARGRALKRSQDALQQEGRTLSPKRSAEVEARLESYFRSETSEGLAEATKRRSAQQRADIFVANQADFKKAFESSDASFREDQLTVIHGRIDEASALVIPKDKAAAMKAEWTERFSDQRYQEVADNLPFDQAMKVIDGSDLDPVKKDHFRGQALQRLNFLDSMNRATEAAARKQQQEARDLNEYNVGLKLNEAVRGRNKGALVAVSAEISVLTRTRQIDLERGIAYQGIITTTIERWRQEGVEAANRPVRNDRNVFAEMLRRRDAGEPIAGLAQNAYKQGRLNDETALAAVEYERRQKDTNAYFNLHEYKLYSKRFEERANAFLDMMAAMAGPDIPTVKSAIEATKSDMLIAFDTDVAAKEKELGPNRINEMREWVPRIAESVEERFFDVLHNGALGAKPATPSWEIAQDVYKNDPTKRRQEMVSHALNGTLPLDALPPELKAQWEQHIERAKLLQRRRKGNPQ